ncbi:MAG: tRNA epoxyqueuosine(34) reductase QueG, partial [bacterium]
QKIKAWGAQLGFAHTAISDIDLGQAERRLADWLANNFHGEMAYMARHGVKRARPDELVAGTIRVITVRMDYLPQSMRDASRALADPRIGYIARYALGRDYHKVIRRKLQRLADRITARVGRFGYRALCDSAPVMEKALAQKSGHGWLGKHTNILNRESGSWFFLGELYTDLPLPTDAPVDAHCGSCDACIRACPTGAIVAPYRLDARRCISYLTIELRGAIPMRYRKAIGNRVFGCDDCQLVCPWNRYAKINAHGDFAPRDSLDATDLIELFDWSEDDFDRRTRGSAIRRIGHARWLRNLAVALGNAPTSEAVIAALRNRREHPSAIVREHVEWALAEHGARG